jgi:hypothetical protein
MTKVGAAVCGTILAASSVVSAQEAAPEAEKAAAPAPTETAKKVYDGGGGWAPVLPETVARVRTWYGDVKANNAYDHTGKKHENSLNAAVGSSGVSFEYGLTKTLSLGVIVPVKISQKFEANDTTKAAIAAAVNAKVRQLVTAAVTDAAVAQGLVPAATQLLMSQGMSAAQAAAQAPAVIAQLRAAPAGFAMGTTAINAINAATPGLNCDATAAFEACFDKLQASTIEAQVAANATPAAVNSTIDGMVKGVNDHVQTGLGDIEIGGKQEILKQDGLNLSVMAGFRLPTGKIEPYKVGGNSWVNVGAGAGFTDFEVVPYVDYRILPGFWYSAEARASMTVAQMAETKGKSFTSATTPESDYKVNYERKGMGYKLDQALSYGWGVVSPVLAPLSMEVKYHMYNGPKGQWVEKDAAGTKTTYKSAMENERYAAASVSFDGLGLPSPFPFVAIVSKNFAFSGANFTEKDITSLELRTYAKF